MLMLPRWFLQLAFHLLYNQLAWTYDLVAWLVSFGQWADWRRTALTFLQPGSTLELAYGTGGLFVDMLKAGQAPVGIDLSPYMARIAKHRIEQAGFTAPLCQAQAEKLPYPNHHFMNIVATFPTEYIFQPATLAEVYRVLKPSGRLIIVLEGHLRGPWPIRSFMEWLYVITGQRDYLPPSAQSMIQNQALNVYWHLAQTDTLSARLLIAEKSI